MDDAQEIIEQNLMATFRHEGAQRAGRERREIDRLQLRRHAAGDEGHQAGGLGRGECLRQQAKREAREIVAALAVAQPVGDERAEIDLPQLGLDRAGLEEMHLDELAELVGDALLIALDDRGMRDRQAQRPLEQRHHRVPVSEPADGCSLRERRHEAEGGMHMREHPCDNEQCQRPDQHQCRLRLDTLQLGCALRIAGCVEGEGGRGGHERSRINEVPEERRRRVSKDEGPIVASWFETAQERLLTMRGNTNVGSRGPKKKARESGP